MQFLGEGAERTDRFGIQLGRNRDHMKRRADIDTRRPILNHR